MERLRSASLALALVLSAAFVALLCVLVALRVAHPYLLEWQEGAMVDQVVRILAGDPLYAEPTIEFVAQIYAPLYFYVSAAVGALTGPGFVPLRLVSIAATAGCLGLVALFVRRETHDTAAAILSVGLFAATYPLSAAFLDVGRVDALFVFFCMAGVTVARGARSTAGLLAAAALFVLAFGTKQQGLLVGLAMAAWLAFARGGRAALAFGGALAVGAGAAALALSVATDGWSTFYLFDLPRSHALVWPLFFTFWWTDMLRPLGPACALAAVWLGVLARERRTADLVFWTALLGALFAVSLGSRMHWGGATNVLLPAHLGLSLAWGVAIHRLVLAPPVADARACAVAVLAVLQLGALVYDPRPLVPTAADRRAGDAFVAALAALDGDVLATWHGHLPRLAGKRVFAHRSAVHDVMRSDRTDEIAALQAAFDAALAERRFGAVVVDQPYFLRDYEKAALEGRYELVGPMLEDGLEIGGLLGYRANPRVYLPVRLDGSVPVRPEGSLPAPPDGSDPDAAGPAAVGRRR